MTEINIFDDPIQGTVEFHPEVPDASSGDGVIRTKEQMLEWAEKFNCSWVEATDKQLFIDIDSEKSLETYKALVKLFNKRFNLFKSEHLSPSKQGPPHYHAVVELRQPLPLMTRIALQACLGSDPTRELISIYRALNCEENVVVFFEKKASE